MDRRLTLLLPVRNAQASLSDHVSRILDTVADLTSHFELVIVDRGSTDATTEVADELARRYPQVRAVLRTGTAGRSDELPLGLPASSESCVVIDGADTAGSLASLARNWRTQCEILSRIAGAAGAVERQSSLEPPRKRPTTERTRTATDEQRAIDAGKPIGPARPNFLARLKHFALGE